MKKKYLISLIPILVLSSCSSEVTLVDAPIYKDEKFNAAIVDISIEDFNNLGFTYGDSVSVYFSSHFSLKDVPYYNGYYVKNGYPIVAGYLGQTHEINF